MTFIIKEVGDAVAAPRHGIMKNGDGQASGMPTRCTRNATDPVCNGRIVRPGKLNVPQA